tara:strand:- start:102731 stop:103234 length:504 start_codon:yes stop_codon:yes gene_type:complete
MTISEVKVKNNKSQLLGYRFGAMVCPVLAVLAFQFVQGNPASAHAGMNTVEFLEHPDVPESWGVVARVFHPDDSTTSPFWYEEIEVEEPSLPEYAAPTARPDAPDPTFVLSAVLPSASKSYAVVNGKPYSTGDTVVADWIIVEIAGQERYIIMEHSSGRRVRVKMNR